MPGDAPSNMYGGVVAEVNLVEILHIRNLVLQNMGRRGRYFSKQLHR